MSTTVLPPWNGDWVRTRFFDAISLILPSGESFVIEAVSDGLRHAAAPYLQEEVDRLAREEIAHRRAHLQYNERLARADTPAEDLEEGIEALLTDLSELPMPQRVALAAAFEHLTALLSLEVLRGTTWLRPGTGPESRLWRWHCEEEVGHRHVTSLVARHCGIGGVRRALALLSATMWLGADVLRLMFALLRHDIRRGRASTSRVLRDAGRFAWDATPGVLRMLPGWLRWMVRG